MIVRSVAAILAASLVLAGSALAQTATGQPGTKNSRGSYLERIDTNKDGFVDRAEFRVGLEQLFERRDANKDGRLSQDEIKTRRGDPAKRLASYDRDKNGSISREEFVVTGEKRFVRCDKNADGRIAKGECGTRRASSGANAPIKQ